MYHLAYFSTATQHFTEDELKTLLESSKKNNQPAKITGVLLFIEGCFLQILEGPKDIVKSLFQKVKKDNRHKDVLRIFEGEVTERSFDKWSMGFKNIPFVEYKTQLGFEDISNEDFVNNIIKKNHPKVIQTLHNFYIDGL